MSQDNPITVSYENIVYALNEENKTASLFYNEYVSGDVIIPKSIKFESQEYTVTIICKDSFRYSGQINSIMFEPNSEIQIIEKEAFAMCRAKKIIIPSNIVKLEDEWLDGTIFLEDIDVMKNGKENIINYNDQLILGKSNLESDIYDVLLFSKRQNQKVVIPSFITTISCLAFSFSQIESIVIPSTLKKIGRMSLFNCRNLKKIEITDDSELEIIDKKAFSFTSIEKLSLPSNLHKLHNTWCFGTPGLKEIQVIERKGDQKIKIFNEKYLLGKSDPKSDIFDVLLFVNRQVKEPIIPPSVTIIAPYAFEESVVEKISIPARIKRLGKYAFNSCKNLKQIDFSVDSEIKAIEKNTFHHCSLESVIFPPHVTIIEQYAFAYSDIKYVGFNENSELQIIGKNAFCGSNIEKLEIPSSVVELREGWCNTTKYLKELDLIQTNKKPNLIQYDGKFILSKNDPKSEIYDVICFMNRNVKTAQIPDFIKVIAPYALNDSSIEKLTFPSHLTDLKKFSLSSCTNLKKVEFPLDSELRVIEEEVFFSTSIKSIWIPPHVTEIGERSFSMCQKLKLVEFPENSELKIFGVYSFNFCGFERISLPQHLTKISNGAFSCCYNLKKIDIPKNSELNIIECDAFRNTSITSLYIPKNVQKIDEDCFTGCNLQIIEIDTENEQLLAKNNLFIRNDAIASIPYGLMKK